MGNHQKLKKFVQQTLGCGCPEDVFNKIEYEKNQGEVWDGRINVGNRLLVYIVHVDSENNLPSKIALAMEAGVMERNMKKFNRFRLVLVSPNRSQLDNLAERTFCESKLFDDKTHLHIISQEKIQEID